MSAVKPRSSQRAACPVMIQLELPRLSDARVSLHRELAKLERLGVHVDPDQPPIRVGPRTSRQYVLRGHATPSAMKLANKQPAVTVFPDLEIKNA